LALVVELGTGVDELGGAGLVIVVLAGSDVVASDVVVAGPPAE
jgi:hypothetical protein